MAKVSPAGVNVQACVQVGATARSRRSQQPARTRSSAGLLLGAGRNGTIAVDASFCSKASSFGGGSSFLRSPVVIKSSGPRRVQTVAAAVSETKEQMNAPRMGRGVWVWNIYLKGES